MKRWQLTDLIGARVFGFEKGDDIERFKPMQAVESITYPVEDNGSIYLHSESYDAVYTRAYYEPVRRAFKDAQMFLASKINPEKDYPGHLLVFDLGQEYYALLTPRTEKEDEEP